MRTPYPDLHEGLAVVERVLVQKKGGEFATVNAYADWAGFDRKAHADLIEDRWTELPAGPRTPAFTLEELP